MSKITLGIDVSKAKFDAAILFENNKVKTKQFENKPSGFTQMTEWLKQHGALKAHACLEATGSYSEALATYLFETDCKVSVVNPAKIKGFAQSELTRTKTDKADSQLIARFCRAMDPLLWKPQPVYVRELQALVRRSEALKDLYQQEKNRLDSASPCVQISVKTLIKCLEEELAKVKATIKQHIEQYPDLQKKKQLLETIPGIGEATIAQILAYIGNVEDFDNPKQLAAFVGLNPKHRQSGSSINGRSRLSKVGNAHKSVLTFR